MFQFLVMCVFVCLASDCRCHDSMHYSSITEYYTNVLCAVECAIKVNIPCKVLGDSSYNVPGWNDYVEEKHSEARYAYLDWLYEMVNLVLGSCFDVCREQELISN